MNRTRSATALAAIATLALLGTACSTKAAEEEGKAGSDGVKTGPGVTDDTITLGALTDLTGPYATLGESIVNAQQMWADQINDDGGICGRQIRIEVEDHGYDVQKSVAAYANLSPDVLAMPQVIGSPVVDALIDDIERDQILTFPQAWSASLLGRDAVQVLGTTYDLDMMRAVDFLVSARGIKEGDAIGHVYFEGEYGANAVQGSKHAAGQHGLTVVEQKIKATDTDLTAQVTALRSEGVKAVLISAGPAQTASLVGVAAASGFQVPVVTSAPGFAPQLLDTPAAPALESMLHIVTAIPSVSVDLPAVKKMVADYEKAYPGALVDSGVLSGYNASVLLGESLKAACDAKDLTRAGLVEAHRSRDQVDVGLGAPQNFSDASMPSATGSYVIKPAKGETGGTEPVEDAAEPQGAAAYLEAKDAG
ncbi:ABC transporter substrate-binding protein [Streptomyces sp. TRM 70351]|uniref:ABC transporter substrate-binding protein n=1 Tax=Streptomyces sp. TRM 70351 TaxID=3116552 RepID=UPI002E7BB3D1|nr:ABC transporter substrate-binding protein [Streptomyces sp. TRM 70351]MEE1927878.1 ABC transporter substrate-binding protein [Streptomyces sp. TRM 70351]